MNKRFKLSVAYLKYYKKQSVILFLGFLLPVFLLTGIASLMYSNQKADLEYVRSDYGDWHYRYPITAMGMSEKELMLSDHNFRVEQIGCYSEMELMEQPHKILLCHANEAYLKMTGRTLLEGSYPKREDEIVMDYYSMHNLDLEAEPGDVVNIGSCEFVLSGLISDAAAGMSNSICVFTGWNTESSYDGPERNEYYYLKFYENHEVYPQMEAFLDKNHLQRYPTETNERIAPYVGGAVRESFFDILKTAIHLPGGRLYYLLGTLNESSNFFYRTILAALAFFGVFVIHSILQILLEKRMEQYGLLGVLGIPSEAVCCNLLMELFLLFVPAYLLGAVMGNVAAGQIYRGNHSIFVIDWKTIWTGAGFYAVAIVWMCFSYLRRIAKYTQVQQMKHTGKSGHWKRDIVSTKKHDLVIVVSKRFLFGKKGVAAGIFASLSLGGLLFLCTTYVADNTQQNNAHERFTDQRYYSDIRVGIDQDNLGSVIPKRTAMEIANIPGIVSSNPVSYTLGEIPLHNGIFHWKDFYAEVSSEPDRTPDPVIMEKYNGRITRQSETEYRIKANVYGYEAEQLSELSDYIIEGEIDPEKMEQENGIVFKTLMDGVGNYDGIDIRPGDKITLKVPKEGVTTKDILRFEGKDEDYIEKEFIIAAVVKRCLSENECFIGADTSSIAVIMPQSMMESVLGVRDYNNISIQTDPECDNREVMKEIQRKIRGLSHCVAKDHKAEIEESEQKLQQKKHFFYGIAVILLGISLLHSMNSIQFVLYSRRHEFGILRAMGITDTGFRRMLIREGIRYGCYTSIVMTILFYVAKGFLADIMQHVLRYIVVNQAAALGPYILMIATNLFICISSMLMIGNGMLKKNIIDEVRQ